MQVTIDSEDLLAAVRRALSYDTLIASHDAYIRVMAETGALGPSLSAMRDPIVSAVVVEVIGHKDRR